VVDRKKQVTVFQTLTSEYFFNNQINTRFSASFSKSIEQVFI